MGMCYNNFYLLLLGSTLLFKYANMYFNIERPVIF